MISITRKWAAACTIILLGSSCSPDQPEGVPSTAQFSGGFSGGYWVDCDQTGTGFLACQLFHSRGGLYQQGLFTFSESLDECYPQFFLTNYRFDDGFIVPIAVEMASGSFQLIRKSDDLALEEFIVTNYAQQFDLEVVNLTFDYRNDCGTAWYEGEVSNLDARVSGNIWAALFVEFSQPDEFDVNRNVPLVLDSDAEDSEPD